MLDYRPWKTVLNPFMSSVSLCSIVFRLCSGINGLIIVHMQFLLEKHLLLNEEVDYQFLLSVVIIKLILLSNNFNKIPINMYEQMIGEHLMLQHCLNTSKCRPDLDGRHLEAMCENRIELDQSIFSISMLCGQLFLSMEGELCT